jgi:hypothetical protein
MEARRAHNDGDGNVLSSRAPTTTGMALQCSSWQHSGGDGRTGSTVMEEMRYTGLTSWRRPVRARGRCPYLFRGFRRPLFEGCGVAAVQERHSVTELTLALPHSSRTVPGMVFTGRVGGTAPGYDSQAVLEGRRGEDSLLTRAPSSCQCI